MTGAFTSLRHSALPACGAAAKSVQKIAQSRAAGHSRPMAKTRSTSHAHSSSRTAADPGEQAHFAALHSSWWDKAGPMAALHAYNPVRLAYIAAAAEQGLGRELSGLRILDIGCGAGILSEALARTGAQVTGLDATPELIAAAQKHAQEQHLNIDYICRELDQFKPKQKFDLIVASEVLEHVTDVPAFLQAACARLAPGGIFVTSTMNRTKRALLLGILAAEHVLDLAPKGTHHWQKFIRPSELTNWLDALGLTTMDISGARYNPLTKRMKLAPQDTAINYLLWAQAQKGGHAAGSAKRRAPAARG